MTVPCTRKAAAFVALLMLIGGVPALHAQEPTPPEGQPPAPQGQPPPPQAAPAAPPAEAPPAPADQAEERTPPRLSFTSGDVSFWRPGAEEWTPAQINTPLAPGDALYAGAGANSEVQIGPRAFARAGTDTQLGLENQEPDFLQLKVTAGHTSLDLRSLKPGQTVEIDTPNAAFTIEQSGYYRADITDNTTTFITRRGGHATLAPAGGEPTSVAPSEEVVVQGTENPSVGTYVAPELDAWDRWNYERTDHLIDAVSARYVPPGVYGIDALDHYGAWRVTPNYGPVWVPHVAPGWAPYSAGRWIWDPYYGWTWVDNAPWGWAPCHYGRWVYASGFWAWAPGPLVAAPVYAPGLVAFFGGPNFGISIGIGAPAVGWVALGWGEPVVPWWGRPGFVGVPWWGGWAGPRVVNNVVIQRTTVVNVNNINVYQNVNVRNAVVAVRQDRFGRGAAEPVRVPQVDLHQLDPVHGRLPVQPVAASLSPRLEHAAPPPQAIVGRSVVATRAPHDAAAPLRAEGINVANRPLAAPRVVPSTRAPHAAFAAPRAPFGQQSATERPPPPPPPQFEAQRQGRQQRFGPSTPAERGRERRPAPPGAPAVSAKKAYAPAPPVRQPHEAVPRASAPRAPAPPPERRAPSARPEHPPRNLPGEPANRLYRASPETRAPRSRAPVARGHNAGSARKSAPPGGRETQR